MIFLVSAAQRPIVWATRWYVPRVSSQKPLTSMDIAIRALPPSAWPGTSKSATVIPEVSCPAVSTWTRAGTSLNSSGAATQATAHTSCTGGPASRGDDPASHAACGGGPTPPRDENGSLTDLYWSRAG